MLHFRFPKDIQQFFRLNTLSYRPECGGGISILLRSPCGRPADVSDGPCKTCCCRSPSLLKQCRCELLIPNNDCTETFQALRQKSPDVHLRILLKYGKYLVLPDHS